VRLNGQLIEGESPAGRDHPVPVVMDLPALLLKPGLNELELDLRYRTRGGLSAATFGPAAELRLMQDRDALWNRELPRSLNMGMAVLALFMLMVRVSRPSEKAMGYFGLLALVGSLRNYTYFAEVTLLPSAATDWLFYAAQVCTAALFGAFAMSLAPLRRRRAIDALIGIIATALPLLAAVLTPFKGLPALRTFSYPVLLVLAGVALHLVWRALREHRDPTHYTLVGSLSVVLGAGAHDYAFQQGYLPITDTFWMPFVMPFALGVYALMLMSRLVAAMNEVERLNVDLEHRVAQRTRALQNANAAKTRFIASASHDLRQPVAAIGLMVGLLREQIAVPRLQTLIDRVDEAVASMETMLKGLLDLSRLESGTVQARSQRVALQTLFDAIQVHEGEAALAKGLRLRFRGTPLAVQSDLVLLEQILRNLVSNAVRYTERGGVLVAARRRGADRVLLQVWDSGVGIAPENQASVFDEFVQVGNAARQRTRGFGLGLSIVKRSAEVLSHALTLRSHAGRGSCFSLMLPRADDERRSRPRPASPVQPLAGLRMVLVEDDAGVRESLVERLQAWGAGVLAFDGVPALRAALPPVGSVKDGRFTDLLITDQRLPGGSGLLVIELVRQRCGATRAMVVTGDTSPGDLTLLAESGLPVLHKPFRAEELLAAIGRALQASAIGQLPP
jgi:signal transduction histidine kinase/ActR/RegA family two-component response regulator